MSYARTKEHVDLAHEILKANGIARDNLPYSDEFIEIHIEFCNRAQLAPADYPKYNDFWKLLCSAAKKGGLAREPKVTTEE